MKSYSNKIADCDEVEDEVVQENKGRLIEMRKEKEENNDFGGKEEKEETSHFHNIFKMKNKNNENISGSRSENEDKEEKEVENEVEIKKIPRCSLGSLIPPAPTLT